MGKPAFVYSTLANDQKYIQWEAGGGDVATPGRSIVIKGGTGVANDRFITSLGVCTEIDEADIPVLEANEVFKLHAKNGFVTIERKRADAEKVAASMSLTDPSAPKTPSDYANAGEGDVSVKD